MRPAEKIGHCGGPVACAGLDGSTNDDVDDDQTAAIRLDEFSGFQVDIFGDCECVQQFQNSDDVIDYVGYEAKVLGNLTLFLKKTFLDDEFGVGDTKPVKSEEPVSTLGNADRFATVADKVLTR